MSVRVEHDAEANTYSLGDDIEGVFIPFSILPADTVQGRITSAQVAASSTGGGASGAAGAVSGNAGDDFHPGDFTDNGDGTFTRKSDGVQGRFTPSGFEPVTTP